MLKTQVNNKNRRELIETFVERFCVKREYISTVGLWDKTYMIVYQRFPALNIKKSLNRFLIKL